MGHTLEQLVGVTEGGRREGRNWSGMLNARVKGEDEDVGAGEGETPWSGEEEEESERVADEGQEGSAAREDFSATDDARRNPRTRFCHSEERRRYDLG